MQMKWPFPMSFYFKQPEIRLWTQNSTDALPWPGENHLLPLVRHRSCREPVRCPCTQRPQPVKHTIIHVALVMFKSNMLKNTYNSTSHLSLKKLVAYCILHISLLVSFIWMFIPFWRLVLYIITFGKSSKPPTGDQRGRPIAKGGRFAFWQCEDCAEEQQRREVEECLGLGRFCKGT